MTHKCILITYHSRVAGVECGLEALLFSFSSSVTYITFWILGQKLSYSDKMRHQGCDTNESSYYRHSNVQNNVCYFLCVDVVKWNLSH